MARNTPSSICRFRSSISVALVGFQLLQLGEVRPDRVARVENCNGSTSALGQPHHRRAGRLRQRPAVDEIGVGEVRVPVEVVVDRVIHAAAILAAEAEIEAGHAEVVDEHRVVRARAERADPHVRARLRISLRSSGAAPAMDDRLRALPDGHLRLGILDVARHAADEVLERVRALDAERIRGRSRRS